MKKIINVLYLRYIRDKNNLYKYDLIENMWMFNGVGGWSKSIYEDGLWG